MNSRLVDFLPVGRENALTGRELASLLDLTVRDVSRLVETARADGCPICASCTATRPGYFLTEDPDELARYIASLDRRLRAIGRTRAALEETLIRQTGQMQLGGWN